MMTLIMEKAYLGIELGSTRIKSVLIDENYVPVASGSFEWENRLEDGIWTYHLDDVWAGIRASFEQLAGEVESKFGGKLSAVGAIGISAMMHGYLPFDREGNQLAGFRTWRNTITEEAAGILTERFSFNIPQRWSIAHLYQAILNGEDHVRDIAFLTTLAGYVHYKLSGKKAAGVGEASGMLPIDSTTGDFNAHILADFDTLVAEKEFDWRLKDILPGVLRAGADAGSLTEEGAKLLDPTGCLQAGIPLCPPEGDAGTGMVATNSVARRTGNVSAGTSVFAMIVLEKELSRLYPEIDIVTTPAGDPVAMVHCNNCTTDMDAWVRLFGEAIALAGAAADKNFLYNTLFQLALESDADCGGLLSYNYHSGEHITGFEQGRPLFVRTPDSEFTLANLMRSLLFSALATLRLGMDILTDKENVSLEQLLGHGGFFKIGEASQRLMAAALNVPVAVMETAGEGGAWGIALLAAYRVAGGGEPLEAFLADRVFADSAGVRVEPDAKDANGFEAYMRRYIDGLTIERAAVENLN